MPYPADSELCERVGKVVKSRIGPINQLARMKGCTDAEWRTTVQSLDSEHRELLRMVTAGVSSPWRGLL